MESEVQGQPQLLPQLVARPTATAQAVDAQLEQQRREKVTAPSLAEPLPAGLVLHQMQRQEQQQRHMQ